MLNPTTSWIAIAAAILTLACPAAAGGDPPDAAGQNGRESGERIELLALPTPPETLAQLIKQGDVRFFVGERPVDTASPDSLRLDRAKLGAETHFRLGFDYRCRSRWRILNSDGRRLLSITVSYQRIKVTTSHEVWFGKRPEFSGFWNNPLVRHEFDHVRLSSDPAIEKRFAQQLRRQPTFTAQIAADVNVTDSYVRDVVDRHARDVFDETIELINIRYKELDRQTDHGLRPLPEDSSLTDWLR